MEITGTLTIILLIGILVSNCVVALKCQFYDQTGRDGSTNDNCTNTYVDNCKLDKEPAYCYAVWYNDTQLQ